MKNKLFLLLIPLALVICIIALFFGSRNTADNDLDMPSDISSNISSDISDASSDVLPSEPLAESVLYYGTIDKISVDENNEPTALQLDSERYGEYIMNLSEDTVWIDCGRKTISDRTTLKEGEQVYIFHSPISTFSLPPQSPAFVVVRDIPQDAGCPQYAVIDEVKEENGVVTVIADNGEKVFTVSEDTTFSPYRTREIVTCQDLEKDTRVMVWYAFSGNGQQDSAHHIMILPDFAELEEDTDF